MTKEGCSAVGKIRIAKQTSEYFIAQTAAAYISGAMLGTSKVM